ncbi:nucleoside phosphorylase domain-containing protein [Aspergillus novoparasiticus]|uniref:Nucleoside phosphorylase domain-containing protein n=1 Tax=Aspergillus novoparasiticus TaxID=986946 RepID=A0A5N6EY10_9EURO|nr:nucleoside phosphorylase domain-containing protein [Aspergillus novoparasiticus]
MLQQDTEGTVQLTRASKPPPNSSTDDESDLEESREISSEAITVAIFCALSYEVVAVKYSLDEELRRHSMAGGPQKYIYSFGRIRGHTTTPNVRFALMVGIGAGIPNPPTRDICLSDIAVGIPQDSHPGVIQYDFGKYEEDGFVPKGSLNKPPSIFISADGSLEEDEIMDRSPLRRILRSSDYTECLTSGTAKLVLRDIRCRKDPVVHRGLILSGSGVIKNPQGRHRLCWDYNNAICFEMQAAGIADEVPYLIFRGICNYADTHKQDGGHYYAAAAAASY